MAKLPIMQSEPGMYMAFVRRIVDMAGELQDKPFTGQQLARRMKISRERSRDFLQEMIRDGCIMQMPNNHKGHAMYLPTRRALTRIQDGVPRQQTEVEAVDLGPLFDVLKARWSETEIEAEVCDE